MNEWIIIILMASISSKNLMVKYYAVWSGRTNGVFDSWPKCKESVDGYAGAKYKSFPTRDLAVAALKKSRGGGGENATLMPPELVSGQMAVAVDGACSGTTLVGEYRGVLLPGGAQIFGKGPFEQATNNAMEYLAIIHGMRWMESRGLRVPLYSDSITAIRWVSDVEHECNSAVACGQTKLATEIEMARSWLASRTARWELVSCLRKWDTRSLGEIPADFGRK